MDGKYERILNNNADFGLIRASKIQADNLPYIEDESFSTFLSGAVAGYNYKHKEIIISNSAKEYSFLYSFQSNSWYRAGVKYTSFVNFFPKFLGEHSGVLYDVTEKGKISFSSKVSLDYCIPVYKDLIHVRRYIFSPLETIAFILITT